MCRSSPLSKFSFYIFFLCPWNVLRTKFCALSSPNVSKEFFLPSSLQRTCFWSVSGFFLLMTLAGVAEFDIQNSEAQLQRSLRCQTGILNCFLAILQAVFFDIFLSPSAIILTSTVPPLAFSLLHWQLRKWAPENTFLWNVFFHTFFVEGLLTLFKANKKM